MLRTTVPMAKISLPPDPVSKVTRQASRAKANNQPRKSSQIPELAVSWRDSSRPITTALEEHPPCNKQFRKLSKLLTKALLKESGNEVIIEPTSDM